ncbi:hypothetical protein [Natrinema sp. CBA1119]|uniref:hypothetical protein n=1 Tax=Natrinema sp. CBA1119 TaxID=1608465 RepID=UPI00159BCB6F|nr:hypothetical protein [Natrinema sp. CBA1119]
MTDGSLEAATSSVVIVVTLAALATGTFDLRLAAAVLLVTHAGLGALVARHYLAAR